MRPCANHTGAQLGGCREPSRPAARSSAVTVLSVDLASRRYRDNGIAVLRGRWGAVHCELLRPECMGLQGEPDAVRFADAIHGLARSVDARLILLDGPQGWRAEQSDYVHQRRCERLTQAPGKTGLPGVVKPATWTRMAVFSIALFDALSARGWPRLTDAWDGERVAIESFPTQAWRSLGLPAMPGRANTPSLDPWHQHLRRMGVGGVEQTASHDEIQAAVAGLAGVQMLDSGLAGVERAGCNPYLEHEHWREGWIISPRR